MIDVYSHYLENHGEYFHAYIKGLYKVLYQLVTNFPNILFEACSAGGNRFDLGMMYFMPQTWASDCSEANSRLIIQEGTLFAYPQNTIGSHVSICPNHQNLFNTSLESRFNVAATGAFGYELDLEQLTEQHIIECVKKIRSGAFEISPIKDNGLHIDACKNCKFADVCCKTDANYRIMNLKESEAK
jgi:alpha-galactosidase